MNKRSPSTMVIRGRIEGLRVEQVSSSLFFSATDRTGMAATGLAAAAMGLSGLAAGMATMSLDDASEIVTKASFTIDGKSVEALLWACPFNDGDDVEVVVEKVGTSYKGFAIADPSKRLIAMYPHTAAGRVAHFTRSFKLATIITSIFVVLAMTFLTLMAYWADAMGSPGALNVLIAVALVTYAMLFGIIMNVSRRYMPFVRIAEGIFRSMGWDDVERIDLRARTLKNIRDDDDIYLGAHYFRY